MTFHRLPVSLQDLNLALVLKCGQSFRWRVSGPNEWSCGMQGRIITLRQDSSGIFYRSQFPSTASSSSKQNGVFDDTEKLLQSYLSLDIALPELYEHWSKNDSHFKNKAVRFSGVRILRQDPWECLIGFICSSNNNIARISQMMEKLCIQYGQKLGSLPYHNDEYVYYDFPPPSKLADPSVESTLRNLGFGYRAKYIQSTAQTISEKPKGWLQSLRKESYQVAKEKLLELSGVGPKVADCVCLMSLDQPSAIPVDTHIWQIATRDYKFKHRGKKVSSLTKDVYNGIGDLFRGLWGEYAGWAHSVLFTADLRVFREYEGVVDGVLETMVKEEEEREGNEDVSGEVENTKTTVNGEGVKKRKVDQVLTETIVREKRRSVKNVNGYLTAYEKTTIVRIHENGDGERIE